MMDRQLVEYFFQEASKAFAFLMEQYSFAPPELEIDDKFHLASVFFTGKNLALECMLEERDFDVECKIVRAFNGQRTPHYAFDENGVRVREGLFELLRRRGVKERLFEQIGGIERHEQIKIILKDYAQMLKKYGQDILQDSPTALD